MMLSEGDCSISTFLVTTSEHSTFSRSSGTAIAAEVSTPQNTFQTIEDAKAATFSSSVVYEDILPGVDLEYIVDPGMVKENIIVKEKAANYEYVFNLNLAGMYPVMQADGSITLYEQTTNEKKYEIPAPYMYDSVGDVSEAVGYTLSGSNNVYQLTVTADANWINSDERTFPVTIDPSYVVSTTTVEDTYIDSDSPSTVHGSDTALWVRSNRISYIKTPTPSVPENMKLHWATLTAFYFYLKYVTSGSVGVTAHRIIEPWEEDELTWNEAATMDGYYGLADQALDGKVTYAGDGAISSSPKQVDFTITSVVKDWIKNPTSNYGIGLKYVEGSANLSVVFKSSEVSYTYRPRVIYEYGSLSYQYTNYYDSTFTSAQISSISSAVDLANQAFSGQFGIEFSSKGSPAYKGTLTDACSNGSGNSCSLECGTPHHKNIRWISEQLSAEAQSSSDRIVFWTNHPWLTYCKESSGQDHILMDDALGLVIAGTPAIHMLSLMTDSSDQNPYLDCMTLILIHETAHTLGLDERYYAYDHSTEDCDCVMEVYNLDTANALMKKLEIDNYGLFCSYCEADLKELLFP